MLRKQTENDVQSLGSNLSQLKSAQQRFADSAAALSAIPATAAGRDMLVPLTSSLYVPGRLGSLDDVLVDIGTGFYVSTDVKSAADMMSRKAQLVASNSSDLARILSVKRDNLAIIENVMQMKAAAARGTASA